MPAEGQGPQDQTNHGIDDAEENDVRPVSREIPHAAGEHIPEVSQVDVAHGRQRGVAHVCGAS